MGTRHDPDHVRPGECLVGALWAGASGFLAEQQREVLVQVARGLSNAEVTRELRISENTVRPMWDVC
jgi:DNA-binding NarL/FixJ family response regulator